MTRPAALPSSGGRTLREAQSFMGPWLLFAAMLGLVAVLARDLNGWQRMILVSLAMFFCLKAITLARAVAGGVEVPVIRGFAYCFLWPGMNARTFLSRAISPDRPRTAEWIAAVGKIGLGLVLVWIAQPRMRDFGLLRAWVGMTGCVFLFHFGGFHLLSCLFRRMGIIAPRIMNRPIAARSLSDFWGARWNTAFRDFSNELVLRPVARLASPAVAGFLVFLFSGLIHEAAISYPASGGYGGPLAYFIIQWLGLTAERHPKVARCLSRVPQGTRAMAIMITLLPLPLLFHRAFGIGVMLPLLDRITQNQ